MDQPLHNYMRPGIVLCVAYPAAARDVQALERSVEAIAADPFFAAVEMRYVPDDGVRRRLTEALRVSRLDAIYEAHPRLSGAALDLNSLDAAVRGRAIEEGKRAIDEAVEIGAERINVVSGRDPGPAGRDSAAEALVDSLCALAAYSAANAGPPLALEPYPRGGREGYLIGPTAEGIALVRLVREVYPDFGLTLDTGHLALAHEAVAASFAAAAPYLGQVHLANAQPGTDDTAPPFGVVGLYDVAQVTEVLLALFRTGFLGVDRRPPILFRVAPRSGERSEWVIAGAKRTLTEAWARL